jgi:hypothetical protein
MDDEQERMEDAATGLKEAAQDGDIAGASEAGKKIAAEVRKMLENTAELCGMTRESMCLIGMAVLLDMARDARPELQRFVAAYAKARLELLAQHH